MQRIILLLFILTTLLSAENRIAVLPFQNNGDSTNNYLQRGIADMFTTALSQQKGLTVIERSRVSELLTEMEFSLTGVVNEKSAVELGNLSGANRVVLGSFIKLGSKIRIDARLVDVEKGEVVEETAQSGVAATIEELDNAVEILSRSIAKRISSGGEGPIGDPQKPALLEMFVTNFGAYMITIDGKMMDFSQGYSSQMELSPGNHHLSITKGVFRKKRIIDTTITIPGGYHIKMRFDARAHTLNTYAQEKLTKAIVKKEEKKEEVDLNDVVSGSLFMTIVHQVQEELFFDTQEAILSARLSGKAITTAQLTRILESFEFDDDRLKIAKTYYSHLTDRENFLDVLSLFEFDMDKKELIEWHAKQ